MFKFHSNDGLNIEIRQLLNKLQPLKVQNLPKQNSQTRQRRKNSNLYCVILIQHSGTMCDNGSELLLIQLIAIMCLLVELLTTQHISIYSIFMFTFILLFHYQSRPDYVVIWEIRLLVWVLQEWGFWVCCMWPCIVMHENRI